MEYVFLSALQHYQFCPRQYALIYLDGIWKENAATANGHWIHERAHSGEHSNRDGVQTLRSLALVSHQHRLRGVADIVEIENSQPIPVEYKSGRKKSRLADELQLCAQAMCLEEMLDCTISQGYIYHNVSCSRRAVTLDKTLRQHVLKTRDDIQRLMEKPLLPLPAADKRCEQCSLIECCEPFSRRDFPKHYDPFSLSNVE